MTYQKSPNSRRTKVFSKTDGKCYYCGTDLCFETFHIDHIHPTCKGGVNLQENLAPACPHCNTSKGTRSIEEWRTLKAFRMQFPDAPKATSLNQVQWMLWRGLISLPLYKFAFEVEK